MPEWLVDLWKHELTLWIAAIWERAGFWRPIALLLFTVLVMVFYCRKTLAQWVLGLDGHAHDATLFQKLDNVASEQLIRTALNNHIWNHWIEGEELTQLLTLRDSLNQMENQFLNVRVRRAAKRLETQLAKLLNYTSKSFFGLHIPERRYALYPESKASADANQRARYEEAASALGPLIDGAWSAYRDYRLAVKRELRQ